MAEQAGGRSYAAIALFVMVIAEIPNFFSGFLPSLFTIATFSKGDPEKMAHTKVWIRRGEIQSTGMSVMLGAATALLAAEAWPFIGAILMCGYLINQYERALRKGQDSGPGLDIDKPEQG